MRTWAVSGAGVRQCYDVLATEEPLQVRLVTGGRVWPVAVTMRTPGADFELAAGFLYNEGIIKERAQVGTISYCADEAVGEQQRYNIVNVEVAGRLSPAELAPLERHFTVNSACGVCGRATIDDLAERGYAPLPDGPKLQAATLHSLPGKLRQAQRLFGKTGGLHAAALFTATGELVAVREDVGRHNALDKLAGWALLQGRLPLSGHIIMVSGRSSFELVQKTICTGAPVLSSVSAPSSLAVALSARFGLTLVGFLRDDRFNVYAGAERAPMPAMYA